MHLPERPLSGDRASGVLEGALVPPGADLRTMELSSDVVSAEVTDARTGPLTVYQ